MCRFFFCLSRLLLPFAFLIFSPSSGPGFSLLKNNSHGGCIKVKWNFHLNLNLETFKLGTKKVNRKSNQNSWSLVFFKVNGTYKMIRQTNENISELSNKNLKHLFLWDWPLYSVISNLISVGIFSHTHTQIL